MAIKARGKTVRNTRTGATGEIIAVWRNAWTNQVVVNVRSAGMVVSWNAAVIGKVA